MTVEILYLTVFSLLSLLLATALLIAASASLLVATLLMSLFSLLCATLFAALNAPDVAFTETAVGAGATSVLFLAAIAATQHLHAHQKKQHLAALLLAVAAGAFLLYSIADLPPYGQADAPANLHLAQHYLSRTEAEIGVPNVVTAILASYRGFDTLGELVVIFTAGIGAIGCFAALSEKDDGPH